MVNARFKKRKLEHYIDNNISLPADEQTTINLLCGYILANNIDAAKNVADNLMQKPRIFIKSAKDIFLERWFNIAPKSDWVRLYLFDQTTGTQNIDLVNNKADMIFSDDASKLGDGKSLNFTNGNKWTIQDSDDLSFVNAVRQARLTTANFTTSGLTLTLNASDASPYEATCADGFDSEGNPIDIPIKITSNFSCTYYPNSTNLVTLSKYDDGSYEFLVNWATKNNYSGTTPPSNPSEYQVYYNETTKKMMQYLNGQWVDRHAQYGIVDIILGTITSDSTSITNIEYEPVAQVDKPFSLVWFGEAGIDANLIKKFDTYPEYLLRHEPTNTAFYKGSDFHFNGRFGPHGDISELHSLIATSSGVLYGEKIYKNAVSIDTNDYLDGSYLPMKNTDSNITMSGDQKVSVIGIAKVELTQDQITNLYQLQSDYINGEITDQYITLFDSITFSRSGKIPTIIPYYHGETPSIKLQFAYWLEKLYQITNIEDYHIAANVIITRLNSNMAVGSHTAGLSSFTLLYDTYNNLVQYFRSGSYISDMIPIAWLLFNYDTNLDEIISYLKDSQQSFYNYSGALGPFVTVFNLEESENYNYGNYNKWIFKGVSGDETDFKHQYKTVLNVAFYYYERFKRNNEIDQTAKDILDNFLSYIYNRSDIPTTISYSPLYCDNEDIECDNDIIYCDQEDIYTISTNYTDFYYSIMLGFTALLKFLVDREENSFKFTEQIVNSIIEKQLINGNIAFESDADYKQLLVWQFLSLYQSINDKSYYDIINDALAMLMLDPINESNKDTHPQRIALKFCQDGINFILLKRYFEFTLTQTVLKQGYEYNLSDLGIDHNRIESISFYDNEKLYYLREISYSKYLEYIQVDNSINKPEKFAINNGILYLYRKPDKDYQITISHYKLEEDLENKFNKVPKLLPQCWYHVLKYYITWRLAVYREDSLSELFDLMFKKSLSLMTYCDSGDQSEYKQMPNRFSGLM